MPDRQSRVCTIDLQVRNMNPDHRKLRVVATVVWLSYGLSGAFVAAQSKSVPQIQVPDGFTLTTVAEPPMVRFPMLGCFDDRGRLFVCESAGINMDKEGLLKELPNFIRLLEDTDGDGQFDHSTIFAEKMTFPSGALWHDGALYVTSPPSLWRLEDTDDDGIADRREELITGFNFRGHAGDIHGPHLGPDGRLYFLDGTMGHEIRDRDGGLVSKGVTARIFSSKLDGSDLETFCGGGMANPAAAAFSETGDLFAVTTFFHYHPTDRIRQDALFHGVYGGVYPRGSRLNGEFKPTGSLLPPLQLIGMSAPSNVMCYRGTAIGRQYQGNLLVSHFNTHRVSRFVLERDGSTFRTRAEPFVTSTNSDFHPCAVIEDADGSLLLIDTGGWFKEGCPTSVQRPNVTGAIYRITKQGAPRRDDVHGQKIQWDAESQSVAGLLNDDRFVVRNRAIFVLASRKDEAIPSLTELLTSKSTCARRNAVWTLMRIGTPEALAVARRALDDKDSGVRQVAARCAGRHRDSNAHDRLVLLLADRNPAVKRQAAAALGRIRNPKSTSLLLQEFETPADRMLEHAIVYALIEIADRESTLAALRSKSTRVRRAALIALDKMEGGRLTREMVAGLLPTNDRDLQNAIVDVVSRKPEWSQLVVELLNTWLQNSKLDSERESLLRDVLYALRREPVCQSLMAETLLLRESPDSSRSLIYDVMKDSGFSEFPVSWQQPLLTGIGHSNSALSRKALLAISSTTSGQFDDGLLKFSQDKSCSVSQRVQAISILTRRNATLPAATFDLLCRQLGPDASFETRLDAARSVGNCHLNHQQLDTVIQLAATAGPLELPLLLGPLASLWTDGSEGAGERLGAALRSSPGFASLTEDQLTQLFNDAPDESKKQLSLLNRQLRDERAKSIRTHLRTSFILAGGDAVRGRSLFYSKRILCSACHRAGPNEKSEIGPDLRRIGAVRSPRDLLEAILVPSASFARGFEPKSVVLKSGRVISGVIRRESDDMITLYTTERREVRIARSDIDKIVPSKVSIMPQALERLLTTDDMRDLLAFLGTLKRSD